MTASVVPATARRHANAGFIERNHRRQSELWKSGISVGVSIKLLQRAVPNRPRLRRRWCARIPTGLRSAWASCVRHRLPASRAFSIISGAGGVGKSGGIFVTTPYFIPLPP